MSNLQRQFNDENRRDLIQEDRASISSRLSGVRRPREDDLTERERLQRLPQEDRDRIALHNALSQQQREKERSLLLAFDTWCGPNSRIEDEEEREEALLLGTVPQADAITTSGISPYDLIKLRGRCFSRSAMAMALNPEKSKTTAPLFPSLRVPVTELDLLRIGYANPNRDFVFFADQYALRLAIFQSENADDNQRLLSGELENRRTNDLLALVRRPPPAPNSSQVDVQKEFAAMIDEPLGYFKHPVTGILTTIYYDAHANRRKLFVGLPDGSSFVSYILDEWIGAGDAHHKLDLSSPIVESQIGVVPDADDVIAVVQQQLYETARLLLQWRGHGIEQFGMTAIQDDADPMRIGSAFPQIVFTDEELDGYLELHNIDPNEQTVQPRPNAADQFHSLVNNRDHARAMFDAAYRLNYKSFNKLGQRIERRNLFKPAAVHTFVGRKIPAVKQIIDAVSSSVSARDFLASDDFDVFNRERVLLNDLGVEAFRSRVSFLLQAPIKRALQGRGYRTLKLTYLLESRGMLESIIDQLVTTRGKEWWQKIVFFLDYENKPGPLDNEYESTRALKVTVTENTVMRYVATTQPSRSATNGTQASDLEESIVHRLLSHVESIRPIELILQSKLLPDFVRKSFLAIVFQYVPASIFPKVLLLACSTDANDLFVNDWECDIGCSTINASKISGVILEMLTVDSSGTSDEDFFENGIDLLERMFRRLTFVPIDENTRVQRERELATQLVIDKCLGQLVPDEVYYFRVHFRAGDSDGPEDAAFLEFPPLTDLAVGLGNANRTPMNLGHFTLGRARFFIKNALKDQRVPEYISVSVIRTVTSASRRVGHGREFRKLQEFRRVSLLDEFTVSQVLLPDRVIVDDTGSLISNFQFLNSAIQSRVKNSSMRERLVRRSEALASKVVTTITDREIRKSQSDAVERCRLKTIEILASDFPQPVGSSTAKQDIRPYMTGFEESLPSVIWHVLSGDRVLRTFDFGGDTPVQTLKFDAQMLIGVFASRRARKLPSIVDDVFAVLVVLEPADGIGRSIFDKNENPPYASFIDFVGSDASALNYICKMILETDSLTVELSAKLDRAITANRDISGRHVSIRQYQNRKNVQKQEVFVQSVLSSRDETTAFNLLFSGMDDNNLIDLDVVGRIIAGQPSNFSLDGLFNLPGMRESLRLPGFTGTRSAIMSNDIGHCRTIFKNFDRYHQTYPSAAAIRSMIEGDRISPEIRRFVEAILQSYVEPPRFRTNSVHDMIVLRFNRLLADSERAVQ